MKPSLRRNLPRSRLGSPPWYFADCPEREGTWKWLRQEMVLDLRLAHECEYSRLVKRLSTLDKHQSREGPALVKHARKRLDPWTRSRTSRATTRSGTARTGKARLLVGASGGLGALAALKEEYARVRPERRDHREAKPNGSSDGTACRQRWLALHATQPVRKLETNISYADAVNEPKAAARKELNEAF